MSVYAMGWQALLALMGNVTVISWVSQLLSLSLPYRCSSLTIRAARAMDQATWRSWQQSKPLYTLLASEGKKKKTSGTTTQGHLSLPAPLLTYGLASALPFLKSLKL